MFTLESFYFERERYFMVDRSGKLTFYGINGQKNIEENEDGNWIIDSLKEAKDSGSNEIAITKSDLRYPFGLQTWYCNDGCNMIQVVQFKLHNVNISSNLN